ncbi:MAG TPA: nuclear transport factor 2 family protein [Mycobacterium sp.]|nr:nuclear transport factor 2 family protein [Mycobacterium sp.]
MTDIESIRIVLDEREIRKCVMRYCHATDRQDWAAMADCFASDAIDDHGAFQGTAAQLAKYLEDRASSRGAKQHYVANQLIEIDGDDAVSETYYFCYIEFIDDVEYAGGDGAHAVIIGGRYVDELRRESGTWRIAKRTAIVDWSRDLGAPVSWDSPAAEGFARGRHDGTDPAQLAFAELRNKRSRVSPQAGQ